jgi:hypothetical protein
MRRWYSLWQYLHGSVQDQLQWLFSDNTNRGLLPAFVLAFPNLETMSNEGLLQVMMLLVVPRDRRQYILSILAAYKANPYRAPGEGPFTFQNCKAELAAVLAYLHYIKVLLTMLDMVGGWAHSLSKMLVKGPGKPTEIRSQAELILVAFAGSTTVMQSMHLCFSEDAANADWAEGALRPANFHGVPITTWKVLLEALKYATMRWMTISTHQQRCEEQYNNNDLVVADTESD